MYSRFEWTFLPNDHQIFQYSSTHYVHAVLQGAIVTVAIKPLAIIDIYNQILFIYIRM